MQLTPAEKDFIRTHRDQSPAALALLLPVARRTFVLNQINGRQRIAAKVPAWDSEDLLFPPQVSLEQCSSEATARFKATLAGGARLLDGTGGFGTDVYFMSKKFETADYFEMNTELCDLVRHNFTILGKENVRFHNGNSIEYLRKNTEKYDWIYLDPARRDNSENKVFRIADCTPDVAAEADLLQDCADRILLKMSPLLDVKAALRDLPGVQKIYAVAVKNEVKELLLVSGKEKTAPEEVILICADIQNTDLTDTIFFTGKVSDMTVSAPLGAPAAYLYEPGRAVLKAGLQDKAAVDFSLRKLADNSHFYTSEALMQDYPGRIFSVNKSIKPKQIKKHLHTGKANVIARNYPLKASQIYEKYKITPGGNFYLLATRLTKGEKVMLLCERLR